MSSEECISVFVMGDVALLRKDGIEEFKREYNWREDRLSWELALLLRDGYVSYVVDDTDESELALEAIENTLRILGISWDDVRDLVMGGEE
jgi:hypothetical protein